MTNKTYICSNCVLTKATTFKEIEDMFGWRNMGKVQRPQSQCRACRNNKKMAKVWKKEALKASKKYAKNMRKLSRGKK